MNICWCVSECECKEVKKSKSNVSYWKLKVWKYKRNNWKRSEKYTWAEIFAVFMATGHCIGFQLIWGNTQSDYATWHIYFYLNESARGNWIIYGSKSTADCELNFINWPDVTFFFLIFCLFVYAKIVVRHDDNCRLFLKILILQNLMIAKKILTKPRIEPMYLRSKTLVNFVRNFSHF